MILDIDRLHKEGKTERRSGRTTDMLADVVGSALVSGENKTILVVSVMGRSLWKEFIEVLRAIDPHQSVNRSLIKNHPCISIVNENGATVKLIFSDSRYSQDSDEVYIDHSHLESKKREWDKMSRTMNPDWMMKAMPEPIRSINEKDIIYGEPKGPGFLISTIDHPEHHYWTKRLFIPDESIPYESIPYKRYFIGNDPYIDDKIDPPLA